MVPYRVAADGSTACAGVLVIDARGIEFPGWFVERSAGSETGFSRLTAGEPVEPGQLPQSDGLVGAGGGQGAPVRSKRHPIHRVGVAGQRLAQLVGTVPVAEIPQDDGPVETSGGQGAPV